MMQSCASAWAFTHALDPWGSSGRRAHSSSRHISAMFEYGFPPPRIVASTLHRKLARAPNDADWYPRSGEPFHAAGRKTTPSSGSPVVTKRQSAMTSLRASATIMVLRVPIRLSAVRARGAVTARALALSGFSGFGDDDRDDPVLERRLFGHFLSCRRADRRAYRAHQHNGVHSSAVQRSADPDPLRAQSGDRNRSAACAQRTVADGRADEDVL